MIITNTKSIAWGNPSYTPNKYDSANTKKQEVSANDKPLNTTQNTSPRAVSENTIPSDTITTTSNHEDKKINDVNNPMINVSESKTSSSSMMSRNFASNEEKPSRYISAIIDGFQEMQQFKNESAKQINNIMETAKSMYQAADNAGEQRKALTWAEENLNLHGEKEVQETADETYLKAMKERILEELEKLLKEAEGIEELIEEGTNPESDGSETEEGKLTTGSGSSNEEPQITVSDDSTAPDMSISTGNVSSGTGDVSIAQPSEPTQTTSSEGSTLTSQKPTTKRATQFSLNIIV